MTEKREPRAQPPRETPRWPLLVPILLVAAFHLPWIRQYGIFRDELYYLACAQRLDWGYVDQPPLSIAVLRGLIQLFGDDLAVLRIASASAIAISALLTSLMARRLDGGPAAQLLAGVAVAVAPVYLVVGHLYTMNSLDILIWTLAAWLVLCQAQGPAPWRWPVLGVVLGLGLLNKWSVLWLLLGLFVGLVATPHRRRLREPGPWIALAIAVAIFAPHVLWQVEHAWIGLEFVRNATMLKMKPLTPWDFLATQFAVVHPLVAVICIWGAIAAFRKSELAPARIGVWVFLTVLAVLLATSRSRPNYLSMAYPTLIATGAVAIAARLGSPKRGFLAAGTLALAGIPTALLCMPILPVEVLTKILSKTPVDPPREERGATTPIQGLADMFGWEEMTLAVAKAYRSLPPQEQRNVKVFTRNYGEAAAIEHYGPKYGLPKAISGHNNYWLWGPDGWNGGSLLVLGEFPAELRQKFRSVEKLGSSDSRFAMPEERRAPVYIARGLIGSVQEFWNKAKLIQ